MNKIELTAKAQKLVKHGTDQERIDFLRKPKWIGYSKAKETIDKLDDIVEQDRSNGTRIRNLILYGDSNNGKSFLAHNYNIKLRDRYDEILKGTEDEGAVISSVLIQAPISCEERRLYEIILNEMKIPYRFRDTPQSLLWQLINVLNEMKVKLLIIDEFQNILTGPDKQQRKFLITLKNLSNSLKLPICLIGTVEAKLALNIDDNIARRFDSVNLPLWQSDREFSRLLNSFQKTLPLKKEYFLRSPEVASFIIGRSEGLIGEMWRILELASIYAIKSKVEKIDLEVLNSIDYVSPSQRRNG